jgi:TonB family protein
MLPVLCLSASPDDESEDRKGKFVRVASPGSIVVMRFNREYFFDLLGVQPALGVDRSDPIEKEARKYLTSLLEGKRVLLQLDDSVARSDQVRNHVGYLYIEDGTCLNAVVLIRGYGRVDEGVAFSRLEEFKSYERKAQEMGLGIWKDRQATDESLDEGPCTQGTIAFAGVCGVSNPEIIPESKVAPKYPGKARRKQIEGRVVLRALVSRDGAVRDVEPVKSPNDLLTEAAVAAVSSWRFRPALKDGEPVDVYFTVVVEFYLAHDAW